MGDVAHSTFNAVTGVSANDNRNEIRAFRPILEWRRIIESVGFTDTYLYEMEPGDPTIDEMMCYYKESLLQSTESLATADKVVSQYYQAPKLSDLLPKEMASTIEGVSDQLPTITLELLRNAVDTVIKFLIGASEN